MAILAPLAVYGLIPRQNIAAGLLMFIVAVLDVVAAVALMPLLRPAGDGLTIAACASRCLYAVVLAGASILLSTGQEKVFMSLWQSSLALFGIHLLIVGLGAWRSPLMARWLAPLIGLAGAGYLCDGVLTMTSVNLGFQFSSITFVGEVALMVWLLIWGGRLPQGSRRG